MGIPVQTDHRFRWKAITDSDARRSVPAPGSCRVQPPGLAAPTRLTDERRRSGRGQRATARRRRGRRASVTPAPLAPAPWPFGAMPSTCASARRRPCAAPRSSCACACRLPWPPSSCHARRPAARCPRSPRWRAVWQRASSVASAPRCAVGPGFRSSTWPPAPVDACRRYSRQRTPSGAGRTVRGAVGRDAPLTAETAPTPSAVAAATTRSSAAWRRSPLRRERGWPA